MTYQYIVLEHIVIHGRMPKNSTTPTFLHLYHKTSSPCSEGGTMMNFTMMKHMLVLVFLFGSANSFQIPSLLSPVVPVGKAALSASSISETGELIRSVRQQMTENEDVDLVMRALRGTNMNDDDAQIQGLQMQLVDVGMGDDTLPLYYDPVALKKFFSKRPLAVLTRIFQLASVGGKVAFNTAMDAALGRIQGNPELEVKRAAELRDTITSLGPMFIKLGQALSIRPDVLSPRSMVELQKLCDKVPSYPSEIAFQTIREELGKSVDEIFSEITPEPVGEFHSKRVFSRLFRGSNQTNVSSL